MAVGALPEVRQSAREGVAVDLEGAAFGEDGGFEFGAARVEALGAGAGGVEPLTGGRARAGGRKGGVDSREAGGAGGGGGGLLVGGSDLGVESGDATLGLVARLVDLLLDRHRLLVEGVVLRGEVGEAPHVGVEGEEARVLGLGRRPRCDLSVDAGEAVGVVGALGGEAREVGGRAGGALAQVVEAACVGARVREGQTGGVEGGVGAVARGEGGGLGVEGGGVGGVDVVAGGGDGGEALALALGGLARGFRGAQAARGAALQHLVAVEAEDAGEDFLALVRLLARELVGAALQQHRGVDERVVVDPQQAVEHALRLGNRRAGQRAPVRPVGGEDFEVGLGRLAGLRGAVAAADAVALPVVVEDEFDDHPQRSLAQQVGVGLDGARPLARLPPERPRERVEERRFALSVAARDARRLEGLEVERRRGLAVGEEVLEAEFDGGHGAGEGRACRIVDRTRGRVRRAGATDGGLRGAW